MENENLERDIEAIEKEKEAYFKGEDVDDSDSEEMENVEVEETEFGLTPSEIDEWVEKLLELKETKNTIELEIDNETVLKVNYEEETEDDSDDELNSDEVIE